MKTKYLGTILVIAGLLTASIGGIGIPFILGFLTMLFGFLVVLIGLQGDI